MKKMLGVSLFSLIFFVLSIQTVSAHAHVVEQSPVPNSQNETSPTEVVIKFNSEVEENFSIKVLDGNGQEVESHSPKISDDHKEISIQLPALLDGIYKIDYYIISSNDGHAIQGNYHILVGTNNEQFAAQEGSSEKGGISTVLESIIFLLKALYYFGFVLLIGWLIWWQTVQHYSTDIRRNYILWGIVFQMIHLVGLISVILIQVDIFTSNGLFFTPNFPFDTSFGLFWLISLVLSLAGFLLLFKNRWVDITWLTILVFCKSLNGHASVFDYTYLSATLNSIHLIAAGIWAAGLTFMIIFWRKYKLYVKEFLPTFSHYAFISFILMAASGSIVSFIYFPSLALLNSDWGRFLLVKLLVVAIIVVIAALIRSKIKKSNTTIGKWIILDFSFMILIVLIVSILTYLSPTT